MKKTWSWLKWTWSGGPSPGLCQAMITAVAPPVASVVSSTFMLRPKALIIGASSGGTMTGGNVEGLACIFFLLVWLRVASEKPAQGFETQQQATGHLVGPWRPDDMLVHRQQVAQEAIERAVLINSGAARRFVDKLHGIDAGADDVRIKAGE